MKLLFTQQAEQTLAALEADQDRKLIHIKDIIRRLEEIDDKWITQFKERSYDSVKNHPILGRGNWEALVQGPVRSSFKVAESDDWEVVWREIPWREDNSNMPSALVEYIGKLEPI